MATGQTELVTELNRCDEIVSSLMNESEVAVDAQGVNLGTTGPLTMLQVGTREGRVYVFDAHTNKFLFGTGYFKTLLETKKVVKVGHMEGSYK